ncbi:MAG: UvrD-helicase domain-containing protein, partial [Bradymonadaceae bacterium]
MSDAMNRTAERERTITVRRPEAVARASDERSDCVITASAGTGKTYTLEHLVLDAVLDGTPIEEILVVTFTRRAAAEMRKRIRDRLQGMLADYEEGSGEETGEGGAWEVGSREAARVRDALRDLGDASITTIHAFCQEILDSHPLEAGVSFDAELADSDELFEDAFFTVLREEIARDDGHRDLLRAYLEDRDLDNLKSNLADLLGRGAELETGELEPDEVRERVSHVDWSEDEVDLPPERARRVTAWDTFAPLVEDEVERLKRRRDAVTYDDLVARVADSVEASADGEGLLGSLRDRFSVALVDEFQDTDPDQWRIFREVFLESDEHRLYLIGDRKQSIFSFRGADLRAYESAKDHLLERTGEEPVVLGRNWRSTPRFLEALDNLLLEGGYFG